MRGRTVRALVVAVILAIAASGCSSVFGSDAFTIKAQFPETFNMFEGSVVRVAGVDVGHVTKVDVPEGAQHVTVEMSVSPDTTIPADARAVIIPEALLGERYIQLDPPYTGGPQMESGATIPPDRVGVPTEFDKVLADLNEFLKALPEDEVARLVKNLATVLDGRGAQLGRTLENIEGMVDALRASDEDLIRLASHLSTLNEAIASRDEEIGQLFEQANVLATTLATNREKLEAALDALVRMTRELGDLLVDHREDLELDLATLARVGRTALRNIERLEAAMFWQKELFRHARRVVNRDRNWLPLVEQFDQLGALIADRVADRVVGLCLRLGVTQCSAIENLEQLPDEICFDPVLPCENASTQAVPLGEALDRVIEDIPELGEKLSDEGRDVGDLVEDFTTPPSEPSEDPGAGSEPSEGETDVPLDNPSIPDAGGLQ